MHRSSSTRPNTAAHPVGRATPQTHPDATADTGAREAFAAVCRALRPTPLPGGSLFTGAPVPNHWGLPFGGLLAAQALAGAAATVPDNRLARSLHLYFVGSGHADRPVEISTANAGDTRSTSWRSITVVQDGHLLVRAEAMFAASRPGPSHQSAMPVVPPPEDLPDVEACLAPYDDVFRPWDRSSAFDLRYVSRPPRIAAVVGDRAPRSQVWVRAAGDVGHDPHLAAALLTYASDLCMLDAALRPHGLWFGEGSASGLSLDHSVWFHATPRVDDWLLIDLRSPAGNGGRMLGIADIHSRDGEILCTVAQLGAVRAPD